MEELIVVLFEGQRTIFFYYIKKWLDIQRLSSVVEKLCKYEIVIVTLLFFMFISLYPFKA